MQNKKGKIRDRSEVSRVIKFTGLERHRGIRPTDIDGIIDYKGNAFFIFEIKHNWARRALFAYGQTLALKNLINALSVPAIVVIATHDKDKGEDILAKDCIVQRYYINGKWEVPKIPLTLLKAIDLFEQFLEKEGIEI